MSRQGKIREAILTAVAGAFAVFPIGTACGFDLGAVGKTYPVIERDASEELRERVRAVDWQHTLARNGIESMKHYKPGAAGSLPRARENRVRMVDMTYTLDFDITDGKGSVVYPKGYAFNPLDFMNYDRTIVVVNGADREQVEWFKASPYFKKPNVMILITDGNYYDMSEELGRPVYFADEKIISRLKLRFVPSVAVQKQRMMEVSEIDIDHRGKDRRDN